MIDEPETATTPQETENGDGITSPHRERYGRGEVPNWAGNEDDRQGLSALPSDLQDRHA